MTRLDLSDKKGDRPLGELVAEAAAEMSTLVRQEVALAKAELAESVKHAGIGVGALGGAGATGLFGLLFLSLAGMFGLEAAGLPIGVAALLVAAVWLVATAILALLGKKNLGNVGGVPRTAKTLKEDVEWARHPTS
ncbi:MAG TPA: phage holin family protein [Mycobacteriales bacterium]|nr:phage holin family protein [Mycobacteriales bacterium]